MPHSDEADAAAICPQCRASMMHIATTPHPVVRNMRRSIYLCSPCNCTRTYMLPAVADSTAEPVQPQPQLGGA
jgi:hypothetical protein